MWKNQWKPVEGCEQGYYYHVIGAQREVGGLGLSDTINSEIKKVR